MIGSLKILGPNPNPNPFFLSAHRNLTVQAWRSVYSMISTVGKWKNNGWKRLGRCYSIHYQAEAKSFQHRIVSTNTQITMLARCGQLDLARQLFDEMPERTVVSWNIMVSAYAKWGNSSDSLALLASMHRANIRPNETTFSTALSVCARTRSFCNGKQLHCAALKSGYANFKFVASTLLYFYSSYLQIDEAKRIFDELRDKNELLWSVMLVGYVQSNLMSDAYELFIQMPRKDVVSWTKLILGYAKSDSGCVKALKLFREMRGCGEVVPNEFTIDSVIRVCGKLGALSDGMIVHGILIKSGFGFDQSIRCALIEFYCGFGAIEEAKRVFDGLSKPCLRAAISIIGELILMEKIADAETIFNRLDVRDPTLCNLMVKGYAVGNRFEDSKRLFESMPQKTIISTNTMISVYSKNGEIENAVMLFEKTKGERNPVTWNSMMSGYAQNDQPEEALQLYVSMRRLSIDCTRSTFSVLCRACSCIGSLQQGQILHANLIKLPFASNVYVGTSLVDMYSKCGSIFDAQKSFSSIYSPNVAAWTALINGFAHHGLCSEAILLFEHMLGQEVVPNSTTFVGLLVACGRVGLVNEGMEIFRSMDVIYRVKPTLEHYACIVDLLGRSGHLQEAEEFVKSMPIEADGIVWAALLNACWFWMDMKRAERVAQHMFSLYPKPTSAYVILSNIYAGLGKWGEKVNVRDKLRGLDVKKDPGCSWIELNGRLHMFSVESRAHPQCSVIYGTLKHLTANILSIVQFNSISAGMTRDSYTS